MREIEIIRGTELQRGDSTSGIVRDKAFQGDDVLFARSGIAGGVESDWHHHGTRRLNGFLASGRLRFNYVEADLKSVEVFSGDFFHIPVGLVHRDVNPGRTREAVVVNILLGKGPAVVNVSEPDLQANAIGTSAELAVRSYGPALS